MKHTFTNKIITFSILFSSLCVNAVEFSEYLKIKEQPSPAFTYGETNFSPAQWTPATKELADTEEFFIQTRTYTSPDSTTQLTQTITTYKKLPFVEIKSRLANISKENISARIKNLRIYSLSLKNAPNRIHSDGLTVRRLKGAATTVFDFVEDRFNLERRPDFDKLGLSNKTGYAAETWLPYFGLDFDTLNGVNFAIGWCGNWEANFAIDKQKFTLEIGIPDCDFALAPDESVMLPSILIMTRQNQPIQTAQNVWRKFILANKTPKNADGTPFISPIYTSCGGNIGTEKLLKIADSIKENKFPFTVFGIDAGWFGGTHTPKDGGMFGDWWKNAGNWQINKTPHPQTLAPLATALKDSNTRLSLWLEIERVMSDTPMWNKYPQFRLPLKEGAKTAVFNLGSPEAQKIAVKTISKALTQNGATTWRIDSNFHDGLFANAFNIYDAQNPARKGLTLMKHCQGLYNVWDTLKQNHPEFQFDNCAAGGRRLDYETMSRTFVMWRSDTQCHRIDGVAESNQIQTFYLSSWLPSHTGGNGAKFDDEYAMASAMNSGFFFFARGLTKPDELSYLKKYLPWATRIQKYILRDFYRLSAAPENFENWCVYQGHDPDKNEGFIAAFRRRQSPNATYFVTPRAIDPTAKYKLEDKFGNTQTLTGRELQNYPLNLSPRDFNFLFYTKI